LIFTPAFYVICRRLADFGRKSRPATEVLSEPAE
jgi:hypothetical protein